MAALFYKVPEGETLDGSLTRNITTLRERVSELKEEMDARMRTYQERLDTLKEKLEAFELIAAQRPGLKLRLPVRGATLPRY
jgi:stress response protein YsnF